MAGVRIRDATAQDAQALVEIRREIVRDPVITFTTVEPEAADIRRDIETASDGGAAYLVAERDGRIVGFATWNSFRSGPGYRFVAEHSVHLRTDAKGQGLGTALMRALMGRASAAGLKTLIAGISGANPGGIAFHERLGFRKVGHLPGVGHKAGRALDLVLMQIDLPENEE